MRFSDIAIRWLILTVAILVTSALFDSIEVANVAAAITAAAILGLLNAFIRPLLIILTLPINIFTLGFFILVINALLLQLTGSFVKGFHVAGFWSAMFASIVISIISLILSCFRMKNGQIIVYRTDDTDRR